MCAFTIKYLFDYDAVNEAVLNALVHNDWTITEPQISVFSDRMGILSHIWHSNREEVRKFMMKRTISGMIGAGSLAHNRRDFVAENVDPDRAQLNICYKNENLKEVYKELFDDAVERYNVKKERIGRLQIIMKKSDTSGIYLLSATGRSYSASAY